MYCCKIELSVTSATYALRVLLPAPALCLFRTFQVPTHTAEARKGSGFDLLWTFILQQTFELHVANDSCAFAKRTRLVSRI